MKRRKRICDLSETIKHTRASWLHLGHDRRIHIVNQRRGQESFGCVSLPRAEFETFVRFYENAKAEELGVGPSR